MIGIVVVSHSRALADAVVALASEMVDADRRPYIGVAAGLDATTFGTDAAAIAEAMEVAMEAAIEQADSPDGVLVFLDLGSAILSAEMALEFVDPDLAKRVRLTPAPLVEGLVAAVVTASTGAGLDAVDAEARAGLVAKQEHLGPPDTEVSTVGPTQQLEPDASYRGELINPHGLHARPAAALVSALADFDAEILLSNATRSRGPVPASSVVQIATLDLRQGDQLVALASGPDADAALAKLAELVAAGFGEFPDAGTTSPADVALLSAAVTAPAVVLPGVPNPDDTTLGDADTYRQARAAVDSLLQRIGVDSQPEVTNPAAATTLIAEVLVAQRSLLADPALDKAIRRSLSSGMPIEPAVTEAFTTQADTLESLPDPYLRERAQDLRSLNRLLIRALRHQPLTEPLPDSPHIVVGLELDAVTAAAMVPGVTLAVATLAPGTSGHGALIAAALGIPLFANQPDAVSITQGASVTLEPVTGLKAP